MNLIINMKHYSKHNLEISESHDSDARIAFFVLSSIIPLSCEVLDWNLMEEFHPLLTEIIEFDYGDVSDILSFFEFSDGRDF